MYHATCTSCRWDRNCADMLGTEVKVGRHKQNRYADALTGHVSEAVNQLVGRFRTFVQVWDPGGLELSSAIAETFFKEDKN